MKFVLHLREHLRCLSDIQRDIWSRQLYTSLELRGEVCLGDVNLEVVDI